MKMAAGTAHDQVHTVPSTLNTVLGHRPGLRIVSQRDHGYPPIKDEWPRPKDGSVLDVIFGDEIHLGK